MTKNSKLDGQSSGKDTPSGPWRDSLFLKDLIRRVHNELVEAREERRADGQAPIFEVQNLTIEVNFVVNESHEVKGGLDFKILTVGASGAAQRDYRKEQVHKIVLALASVPQRLSGSEAEFEIAGSRFLPRRGE